MPRRYPESAPELTQLFDNNRRNKREGVTVRQDNPPGFGRKNIIFYQGDPSHNVYLLLEGRILLTRDFEKEANAISAVLVTAPSILGEPVTTNEHLPHTFSARAFDPSKMIVIQRRHLGLYLYEDPDITRAINLATNNDLAALNQRVLTLSGGSMEQKAASASLVITQNGELVLGGTQEDLAMMAGATRASINKLLGDWEREGVIESSTILGLPNPLRRYRHFSESGIRTAQLMSEGYSLEEALEEQKTSIPS